MSIYIKDKYGRVFLIKEEDFEPGDEILTEVNKPVNTAKETGENYFVEEVEGHADIHYTPTGGARRVIGKGGLQSPVQERLERKLYEDAKATGWVLKGISKQFKTCAFCGKDLNKNHPKGEGRRSDSKYCSEKCSQDAKNARKKERKIKREKGK